MTCELAPELVEHAEPLIVNIVVHPAGEREQETGHRAPESGGEAQSSILSPQSSDLSPPFVQRAHGEWFVAASGANLLTARMDRGEALGFVTPELVADDAQFRYSALECLALLLASWRDRTPVHAGAIVHAGRAALLVGPSSAGKSTLCYACVRAGHAALHPYDATVTPELVTACHDAGLRVNVWTVDDPARILELAEMGVDGVVTNVPDVARAALSSSFSGRHSSPT